MFTFTASEGCDRPDQPAQCYSLGTLLGIHLWCSSWLD